jgi:sarcosine oxidase, subunit beta
VRDLISEALIMKTDVLIIGGGITGCALAYFLSKDGARVTLVEREDLNSQSSGSNAGSIHAQMDHRLFGDGHDAEIRRNAPMTTLLMAAISLWQGLEKELEMDFELALIGGLLVTDQAEQMRIIEKKVLFERSLGLPVDLLSETDIRGVAPYVSDAMIGGALCSIEGEANALLVAPALAVAAARRGAKIMIKTDVLGLSTDQNGFVAETSKGPIVAERVINCAGAEAAAVGRFLGIELPVFGEAIQVNVTEPTAPLVRHLVYYAGDRLTLKQSRRGALIIGGGWPAAYDADGRPTLRADSLHGNLRVCCHVVPASGSVRVIRTWPGIVNDTADGLPIISELDRIPGCFVANFPRMGFTGGPIAARIIANIILGRPQDLDIRPFSFNRFQ